MTVPDDYIRKLQRRLRHSRLSLSDEVLEAFQEVPRDCFVGSHSRSAYIDSPLPIPEGQTISAPHMYAMMMSREISDPRSGMDILEIGTGSGYGAALLAYVASPAVVTSIERIPELVSFAKNNIDSLPIELPNLEIICGDGTSIDTNKMYDLILVTAVGNKIPSKLLKQLKPNGKLIMPLQENYQQWLCEITLSDGEPKVKKLFQVRFVRLIGEEGFNT